MVYVDECAVQDAVSSNADATNKTALSVFHKKWGQNIPDTSQRTKNRLPHYLNLRRVTDKSEITNCNASLAVLVRQHGDHGRM